MGKFECLKRSDIHGQSAAKPRTGERSQTRPRGRRVDINVYSKRGQDAYIYFLKDPITLEIRYIGSTSRMPLLRIGEHFRFRDKTPNKLLQNWLKDTDYPALTIIRYPLHLRYLAEKYWIKYYSSDNRLLNMDYTGTEYGFKRLSSKLNPSKEKVVCRLSDDEIVACYDSITEASVKTNTHMSNIMKCLSGERKTAGSYRWHLKI